MFVEKHSSYRGKQITKLTILVVQDNSMSKCWNKIHINTA